LAGQSPLPSRFPTVSTSLHDHQLAVVRVVCPRLRRLTSIPWG
ncbi:hypothetical protein LINPERHAP1_LOCUS31050, partial [Linum perenne]